jgi:hypothetical protein
MATPPTPAAPSLFDQVKQNLNKMAQPVQAAGQILGQTEALSRISQAASGKAVPGAGGAGAPARSQQAELAVVDQVKRGQQELAKANQMQTLALGQQEQALKDSEEFKNRLMSDEQLAAREKYLETQRGILTDYSSGQRQLDLTKDKAKLEQLGFSMRLSNDKYLNELENRAKIAGLSNAISFEEELTRSIFADEEELFRNDLDFRAMIAADQRTFRDELAQMDINMALDMAEASNRALSEKQMWDGLGGIIQGGASAYASYKGTPTATTGYGTGGPEALSPEETTQMSPWGGGGPR